jgi:hypothetical protein
MMSTQIKEGPWKVAARAGRVLMSVLVIWPLMGIAIAVIAIPLFSGTNPIDGTARALAQWGAEFRAVPVGSVPVWQCPPTPRHANGPALPLPVPLRECVLSSRPMDAWLEGVRRTIGQLYLFLATMSVMIAGLIGVSRPFK